MKNKPVVFFLVLFLGLLAPLAPQTARAQDEVSFDFFYDSLKPYGDWIQVGDYGLCWHPAGVDSDWAPYTDGYWTYTDGGWTWVSYEDYGGVVYHYGRWVNTDSEGWCWVPDYQWAPAWVSWRSSDDYVGWAPLPPECHWQPEVGVSIWADSTYDIGPECYHFCHYRDFGAPVITAVLLPWRQNATFIGSTVNITNITVNRGAGFIFVGGPRFDVVSHRVARPIPTLKLVQQTNITNIFVNGQRPVIQTVQKGNALIVPAPHIRPVANPQTLVANYKPTRVVAAAHVNRGWNLVKNPEELRGTFKAQAKGETPQSAPARAIQPADLKVVPPKLNPAAATAAAAAAKGHFPARGENDNRGNPTAGVVDTGKRGKEKPGKTESGIPAAGVPATGDTGTATNVPTAPGRGKKGGPAVMPPPVTGTTDTNTAEEPKAKRAPLTPAQSEAVHEREQAQQERKQAEIENIQRERQQAETMKREQGQVQQEQRMEAQRKQQVQAEERRNETEARQAQQQEAQKQAQAVEAQRRNQAVEARQAQVERQQQTEAREALQQRQQGQVQQEQRMEGQRKQQVQSEERRNEIEARQAQQQEAQKQAQAVEAQRRNQAVEARQAQIERQQQAEVQRQRAIQQQQAQAQQQQQQRSNGQVNPKTGKKLTPEEAAALQQGR